MGTTRKLLNSLAYRITPFYRLVCTGVPLKSLDKPVGNSTVVMMTGKKYLPLLRLSLWSILKSWNELPRLFVYSDGSATLSEIRSKIDFWPAEIEIHSWQNTIAHHSDRNRRGLADYAAADAFGKKLSIILYHAELGPTVWLDSDILFFRDFTEFIPRKEDGFFCGGSEDWTTAYDQNVVIASFSALRYFDNFSAGMIYISGKNIYEDFCLGEALERLQGVYSFFTEQTFFAHISSKSLGKLWSKNTIKNFMDDKQALLPEKATKNFVGRHYTSNVRHLFWRDAFHLLVRPELTSILK